MIRISLFLILLVALFSKLSAQQVITQGEFEKNDGLILKWNYNPALDSTVARITSIVSADKLVWMLYDPANTVSLTSVQQQLTAAGANLANVTFLQGTAESPWVCDYGPIVGYYVEDVTYNRHIADPQYFPSQFPLADNIPFLLSSDLYFHYEAMPLNLEGGNILIDGTSRGFVGDRVLKQNPAMNSSQIIQMLYSKLGLNNIVILPSLTVCGGGEWGELGRLMKFVDPETVLVAQYPSSSPNYQLLENLASTLSQTVNDMGKNFQVVRLPISPNSDGGYAADSSGEIRSYTSSIFLDNKILIPSYGTASDAIALNTYKQVMPGWQFFQIPAQILTSMHGSLSRLATVMPQQRQLRIRHSKIEGPHQYEGQIWINAYIQSMETIDSVQILWHKQSVPGFQLAQMLTCCGGSSGFLEDYTDTDTLSYYIKVYSGTFTQTLPLAAPGGTYTFWFDPFAATKPSVQNQAFTVYPNPATDSVRIKSNAAQTQTASYSIVSPNGIVVAQGQLVDGQAIKLPTPIAKGIYLITVNSKGKSVTSKLCVKP